MPNFDELRSICGSDETKDLFKFLFMHEERENEAFTRKIVELCDGLHAKIDKFDAFLREGQNFSDEDDAAGDGMECLAEEQSRNGKILQALLRLLDVLHQARDEKRRHVMVMEVHD